MKLKKNYINIVEHYEKCLNQYGDSHLGVDWPNKADALKRYKIMLELTQRNNLDALSMLDFGCGAGHFLEYINAVDTRKIKYTGLDISEKFIDLCRSKYPGDTFICSDVLENPETIDEYDYIVLNGVFTAKRGLTHDEMLFYFTRLISLLWRKCRIGLSFNVFSKHVDWERGDLFHLPFDTLAGILQQNLGRNYIFRNDYGLYEYTRYVFKESDL